MIAEQNLALGFARLERHHVEPPAHDPVRLGEEAVAADVDAIALELDGARKAADVLRGLENDGPDIGAAQQLDGGGEAGRSGADDDGAAPAHVAAASPAMAAGSGWRASQAA